MCLYKLIDDTKLLDIVYLLSSFPIWCIFSSGNTGTDCDDAGRWDTLCFPDTGTSNCVGRCAWRRTCIPRKCTGRNVCRCFYPRTPRIPCWPRSIYPRPSRRDCSTGPGESGGHGGCYYCYRRKCRWGRPKNVDCCWIADDDVPFEVDAAQNDEDAGAESKKNLPSWSYLSPGERKDRARQTLSVR